MDMATAAQTSYSFITNDLKNHATKSVVIPLSPTACAPRCCALPDQNKHILNHDLPPSKPPTFCVTPKAVLNTQIIRGPSERRIRCSSSTNRIRNSWSSDEIKLLFIRSNIVDYQNRSLPFGNSSSSSSQSEPNSPVSDWNVPLLKMDRGKHVRKNVTTRQSSNSQTRSPNQDTARCVKDEPNTQSRCSLTFTDRARQVWTALERKFTTTNKIAQSRSAGSLASQSNAAILNASFSPSKMDSFTTNQLKQNVSRLSDEQFITQQTKSGPLVKDLSLEHQKLGKSCLHSCPCASSCTTPNSNHAKPQRMTTSQSHGVSLSGYACDRHSCSPTQPQYPAEVFSPTADMHELREVTLMRTEPRQKFGIRIDNSGCGVYLTTVLRGSPAALAGLKVGDELIRLNGMPVSHLSATTVMVLIRSSPECLRITFKPRIFLVRVREVSVPKTNGRVGIRIKQRAENLYVEVVLPNSPASMAGIKEGDELLMINHQQVRGWDPDTASKYLRGLPEGKTVIFRIRDIQPQVCTHSTICPALTNALFYRMKSHTLGRCSGVTRESETSDIVAINQPRTKHGAEHAQSHHCPQSCQRNHREEQSPNNHRASNYFTKCSYEDTSVVDPCATYHENTRLVNSISDCAISQRQQSECQ